MTAYPTPFKTARLLMPLLLAALLFTVSLFYFPALGEDTALFQVLPEDAPPLEAHFLSVKAADCTLLRNGDHAMLVDSGNPSEAQVILDYLAAQGIGSLNAIFLSHPHSDHLGGFLSILSEIPVDVCYLPANFVEDTSPDMRKFRALLDENLIPVVPLLSGNRFTLGHAQLIAYQWDNLKATTNNQSMLLHAQYGDRAILLGADIENHAQKALGLALGDKLQADILKVPHHGQNLVMQEFHDAVQPTLAIITNSSSEVQPQLELFKKRKLPWYTTAYGTVTAVTDGLEWTVEQTPAHPRAGTETETK